MGAQPMGAQPMGAQPMGTQSMGAQNAMGSMQDSHNKKLSGQDLLNQARGTMEKKPGIMRQGSMGRDPQGQLGGLSASVGGVGPPGSAQSRMGQHGAMAQSWPSQGPHGPISQGMTGPTTLPSGARSQTSKLSRCHSSSCHSISREAEARCLAPLVSLVTPPSSRAVETFAAVSIPRTPATEAT